MAVDQVLGWVSWIAESQIQSDAMNMVATNLRSSPKFPLGRIVATPNALDAMSKSGDSPHELLLRHVTGDWGGVGKEGWIANDEAVANIARIFSAYLLKDGKSKVWIITKADRAATTLLLPEDY